MDRKTILVIEPDRSLFQTIAEHELLSCGFKPFLVQNHEDGLKIAQAQPPDLLLLHLPLDLFIDFLRSLEQIERHIPTIVIVERESVLIGVELLRLGVRDYLIYPYTPEEMVAAISRVLEPESSAFKQQLITEDLSRTNSELEQRLKELDILLKIGRSVSSPLDLDLATSITDQATLAKQGVVLYEKGRLAQERLALLMELVEEAVWLVDADMRLVAQNKVAGEIVNLPFTEVIRQPVYGLVSSNDSASPELGQLIHLAVQERRLISFEQGVLPIRKEDQPIRIKGKIAPVLQENQIIGTICVFHPLCPESKENRLKLEFADMASHLLRGPLSFIQTSIELMKNSDLDSETQGITLKRMHEQSQRLIIITNELLKMLRLEMEGMPVHPELIDLLPLIEQVLNLIQYEEPCHEFNLVAINELPPVTADPTKTELILLNLLRSAVRRCPGGGNITIKTVVHNSEVMVSIIDDGESIPAHLLDKVFWQFYPIDDKDNKKPSTYYLGLYTTKRLVELQNGRIWAKSQPGQGSQFDFSLPVLERNL